MIVRVMDWDDAKWDPPSVADHTIAQPSYHRLAFTEVRRVVAELFDVPEALFLDRSRVRDIAWPRFGLIFWVRMYCKDPVARRGNRALPMSFPAIARRLGYSDHGSIMHANERARELWQAGGDFGDKMDRCAARFRDVAHAL
jgi:chromosomal replication initiation ATPase DnaA